MGGSDPTSNSAENLWVWQWRKISQRFLPGAVFLGVLARSGVGAVDNISLQRAARISAATSHSGSSLIDAFSKLFALRPDGVSSGFSWERLASPDSRD